MIIDNVTHPSAIGVLIFLRKAYGNRFIKTYEEIHTDYANPKISTWKLRECVVELEKMGYIRSSRVASSKKKRYTIDEDYYRGLVWLTEDGSPLKSFNPNDNATDDETESDNETQKQEA